MADSTDDQRSDTIPDSADAPGGDVADTGAPPTETSPRVRRPRIRTSAEAPTAFPTEESGARPSGHNGHDRSDVVAKAPDDRVYLVQEGLPEAFASTIEVRQGGIGRADAQDINVSMGGIGIARSDIVNVELGGIGAAFAREVSIRQGGAQAIVAREVEIEQAFVQTVVAANVEIEEQATVLVLIAGRVQGSVRTLVDWRGALAFGAAFGAIVGLLRRR